MRGPVRVGIDTGGTFTDLARWGAGGLEIHKVPSTPDDPVRAIRSGLAHWFEDLRDVEVIHGTTVGTNALLERRGARVALVTTLGFEDVLEIGRQNRPHLYDLEQSREEPLVGREARFGVRERVHADGTIGVSLEESEIERLLASLESLPGIEAVAVSLLHSYRVPDHERRIGEALAAKGGFHVSLSSEILPEFREYERTSTTVVNAYLGPVLSRYLHRLETALSARRVRILHSGAGSLSAKAAGDHAVKTVLSGPAGGVLGAAHAASLAGLARAISFDMGGTSTDVSLIRGEPTTTQGLTVGGMPIRTPMLDVHTVGAGGGSIAWLDAGGALKVGPRSAGADPGPLAYARGGTDPTVTDACLVLGRLPAEGMLGGALPLARDAALRGMESLARRAGLAPLVLAEGILEITLARMERAIRLISVERGHDPMDFCLVAFGGAGPIFACELARSLGMANVLVPRHPGALSAMGMLFADTLLDFSRTRIVPASELDHDEPLALFRELESEAVLSMREEGFAPSEIELARSVDLRYSGQSHELPVPYDERCVAGFHALHEQRFGHHHPDWPVEAVCFRVRSTARTPLPEVEREPTAQADAKDASMGIVPLILDQRPVHALRYERSRLRPGHHFPGPALVTELSATTLVPPGWSARVDAFGSLILEAEC